MADKSGKKDRDRDAEDKRSTRGGATVAKVRTRVAQVVWLLFVIAAVFLAVGALCVALDFNPKNPLVEFLVDGANFFDLGIFSRKDGIKQFDGSNADVKNALFNWGLGAIAWLIVGKIVDRIIRP